MSEDDRAVALVDVDGVLNAGKRMQARVKVLGFDVDFPPNVRKHLSVMDAMFECVWATAWEEEAPNHLSPYLGVGEDWPVVHFADDAVEPDATWKLGDVVEWVNANAPDRPVVWVDDDLGLDAYAWARDRDREVPTMLLQTDPAPGFTERDMAALQDWHDSLRERVTS